MAPLARDYAGDGDLRLMQQLAVECARRDAPFVHVHVGDLAWRMYQHLNKLDTVRVRVWLEEDGQAQAWAWLWLPGELDFQVHPDHVPARVDDVLDWFEETAQPTDSGFVTVWALDSNQAIVAALEARGYARGEDRWYEHQIRPLDHAPPKPELPEGFVVRAVRGEEDLTRRVEVHRAAFAPSRVVPESYRRVMQAWPYRAELDHVVVAPDGSFAAFCLCWLDEENRLGELEPVGTHPDYRRRGLARAVCLSGLRALYGAGATAALVYSVGGSEATKLYEALGFRTGARHVPYQRGIS